jgi:hypothetical protein
MNKLKGFILRVRPKVKQIQYTVCITRICINKNGQKSYYLLGGSQGNPSGHQGIFVKPLVREKIHANTLQLPYWFHHW